MNILFRVFVLLGSIVVIALFSALLAPFFIDWDEFTSEFEAQATKIVGQPVRVGGETNLRILPLPYLSFQDLEVGANADGTPLMTVEQFAFSAELFPFLSGEVKIVEMSMDRPEVNLQVSEQGKIAWTNPSEFVVNPEQIRIEKLRVENGSIVVSGLVGERTLHVEKISADIDARSVIGPWRIEADAEVEGVASKLRISTGTFQDDQSLRLKIEGTRLDQPYKLVLDGPVSLDNDILAWGGNFRISPILALEAGPASKLPEALPVEVEGIFSAGPRKVEFAEYRMEIGPQADPYVVTGAGVVDIDKEIFFRVNADGRQIDLDRLQPLDQAGKKLSLESRLGALHDVLRRVPVPTGKGEINAVLPAIVAGDTFIRDVAAVVRPAGKGWEVRSLGATFPGNTRLEANGRVGLHDGFGFSGRLLIASRQPSGFAAWISGNVDETLRRLKTVGLDADLTVTKRQATLENVELRIDDAVLTGKLQRLAAVADRPAIIAELKGNRVNVNDLRAIYSLTQDPNSADNPVHDLDIKVKAEALEAQLAGQPIVAGDVDAHVQVRSGSVSVERLQAGNIFGASISSFGRMDNILANPNGNMKLEVQAADATGLLQFAERFLNENSVIKNLRSDPDLTAGTNLKLELDATEIASGAKGRMLVSGVTGGTALDLQVGFEGALSQLHQTQLSISGSLNNKQQSQLIRQVGVEVLPSDFIGEVPGALRLDFDLTGQAENGFQSQISIAGPQSNLAASGIVKTSDWENFDANLAVTAGTENLAPYITLAGLRVPSVNVDSVLPVSASFKLEKTGADFAVDELQGQVSGNSFSGDLKLARTNVARPRIDGSLAFNTLSLPMVAETVFGRATILGNSLGVDQEVSTGDNANFGKPFYTGIDARLALSAKEFRLGTTQSGDDAELQLVMLDGALDVNDLQFGFLGGQFNGALDLKNTDGTVVANASFNMNEVDGTQLVQELGWGKVLEGKIKVAGSVASTGKSVGVLKASLSGNGFVELEKGRVYRINPDAFDRLIAATDVEGFEIRTESVGALVNEEVLNSGFSIASIDAPFSVNRGKVKFRNVSYRAGETSLVADLEADLDKSDIVANLAMGFAPTKREEIRGADPRVVINWTGPLDDPARTFQTDQLEGYLSLRAFENSQRRLETLEAEVIEKQRMLRQIAYASTYEKYLVRQEEEAIRLEEERRLREAEELKRKEEERKQREAEEAKLAEEERKRLEAEEAERLEKERAAEEERQREEARKQAELQRQKESELEANEQAGEPAEEDLSTSIIKNIKDFLQTN